MRSHKSTLVALFAGGAICLLAIFGFFFFGSKLSFVKASGNQTKNPIDDDENHRGYIFLTYADGKIGELNFFQDCYAKGEKAVEDGRAKSVMEYILDQNFDHDALKKAKEAVDKGEVKTELEYMANHPDSGKMSFLLYYDPMFAAAWGCYLDQQGATEEKILKAEQDLPVPQQPDAALLRFVDNQVDWDKAIDQISAIIYADDNEYDLKELTSYTSSMYAVPDGIKEGTPQVVVRNTENANGHFIMITLKNGVVLKFRLECGYQPVDVPNWTPPNTPPVVNPPSPPLTPKDPKDGIEPNPDATTEEWYDPDPAPEDQDTRETPEPISPDEPYIPPEPPTEEPTTRVTTETTTETTTQVTTETTTQVTTTEDYADVVDDEPADVEEPFVGDVTDGVPTNVE